jgi:adenylate cyclase class 2
LNLPLETEIKIRISGVPAIRTRLRDLGFRIHKPRVFESNVILDTPARDLGKRRELIRIRRVGGRSIVTYKGPSKGGRHKSREEIETQVADPEALETIFARLGLQPTFRYEKIRTEYERSGHRGIVTVDETPVGDFLEIEGSPKWIDATARELGFTRSDYIILSYGELYLQYCRDRGIKPTQMIFQSAHRGIRRTHGRIPERKKAKLP